MAQEFIFCSVVACVRVCLLRLDGIGFFFLVCLDLLVCSLVQNLTSLAWSFQTSS